MRLRWRLLLISAGIALIIISFAYNAVFAGIPYQDPPPDLAARYAFHAAVANTLFWLGGVVCLAGILASILSVVLSVVIQRFRARRI